MYWRVSNSFKLYMFRQYVGTLLYAQTCLHEHCGSTRSCGGGAGCRRVQVARPGSARRPELPVPNFAARELETTHQLLHNARAV